MSLGAIGALVMLSGQPARIDKGFYFRGDDVFARFIDTAGEVVYGVNGGRGQEWERIDPKFVPTPLLEDA